MQTNATDLRAQRAPLLCKYPEQNSPQPGRITIDPEREAVVADYRPEIGALWPEPEVLMRVHTLSIRPEVKGPVVADLLESAQFQSLAQRLIDGHSKYFDDHCWRGRLTPQAADALERLQEMADNVDDDDLVQTWDVSDWLYADYRRDPEGRWVEFGRQRVHAATTDDELAAMARRLEGEAEDNDIELLGDVADALREARAGCAPEPHVTITPDDENAAVAFWNAVDLDPDAPAELRELRECGAVTVDAARADAIRAWCQAATGYADGPAHAREALLFDEETA